MIVEVAGRPAPHVKESLKSHVGALENFKDIEVISIKLSEPREIENSQGLFTCFAEVEFEATSFSRISEVMFDFMPSSVEVVEPSRVSMDAAEASNLLNNISGRMHRYDEVARMAQVKLKQMSAELENARKNDGLKEKKSKKRVKKAKKKKKSKKK